MQYLLTLITFLTFLSCKESGPDKRDKPFEPIIASISDSGKGAYPAGWTGIDLPKALEEISGIAFYQDSLLVCVEDENGQVYFLDPYKQQITRTLPFSGKGDYEGIAVKGADIYVLRSDGAIFKITEKSGKDNKYETFTLPYQHLDMEGLCYDPVTGNLLVAAKSAGKEFEDMVPVFSFSLSTNKFSEEPFLSIPVGEKKNKKGKKGKKGFSPSEISVDPLTGNLIFLDSPSNEWLEFTRDGELVKTISLNKEILPQPEGITFDKEGKMWISSEGKGATAKLVRVNTGMLETAQEK